MAVSEYNKVSFITSHSKNIPTILKQTGGLIVVSDLNDKDATSKSYRMSLWLHGNSIASGWGFNSKEEFNDAKWWQKSYNNVLGGTNTDGSNFFIAPSDIEDSPTYTYNDNGDLIGAPYSIKNRLQYVTTYASDQIGNIDDKFNRQIESINTKLSYTYDKYIPNCIDEYTTYYKDAISQILTYYNAAKSYTTAKITALIGDCPETLDSLQEIREWLENEMSNNLQTLDTLRKLNNNSMLHDDKSDSGVDGNAPYPADSIKEDDADDKYTYLSEYSTEVVFDDASKHTGTYTYYTYDYTECQGTRVDGSTYTYWSYMYTPHIGTYTYSLSETHIVAKNAVHDTQVSSKYYGNHTIDYLFRHIIKPYDYRKPTLKFTYAAGQQYIDWVQNRCEYSNEPKFNGNYIITKDGKEAKYNGLVADIMNNDDDNTAITNRTFTLIPKEDDTISEFNEYHYIWNRRDYEFTDTVCPEINEYFSNIKVPSIENIKTKTDLLKHTNDLYIWANQVKISHGNAVLQPYPLLTDDTELMSKENKFEEGESIVDLEIPLEKCFGFCIYYNELNSDGVIPTDEISMLQNSSKVFIEKTGVKDIEIENKNKTTSKIWFAIPSLLLDDNFVMFTKSYNSGITQPMIDSMGSDILFKNKQKDSFKHANLDYNIITLENVEFAFAEKILVTMFW